MQEQEERRRRELEEREDRERRGDRRARDRSEATGESGDRRGSEASGATAGGGASEDGAETQGGGGFGADSGFSGGGGGEGGFFPGDTGGRPPAVIPESGSYGNDEAYYNQPPAPSLPNVAPQQFRGEPLYYQGRAGGADGQEKTFASNVAPAVFLRKQREEQGRYSYSCVVPKNDTVSMIPGMVDDRDLPESMRRDDLDDFL